MTLCPFNRTGPTLGEYTFSCPACGIVRKSKAERYRRSCPTTTPREGILDELWQISQLAESPTPQPEIETILTRCESCRRFTGQGCDRYGGCTGRRRWLALLVDGTWQCETREPVTGKAGCVG